MDAAGGWDISDDGMGSRIECVPDSDMSYSGSNALRMAYTVVAGGWVDCGHYYDTHQDWYDSDGISFYLHSEQSDLGVTFMVISGEEEKTNPFEVYFEISPGSTSGWEQLYFPWSQFELAPWVDEGGPVTIDPADVAGLGFSVGSDSEQIENTIWIDEISMGMGIQQPAVEEAQVEPGQVSEEEGVSDEDEDESFLGRICPCSSFPLMVGAAAIILIQKKRRSGSAIFS